MPTNFFPCVRFIVRSSLHLDLKYKLSNIDMYIYIYMFACVNHIRITDDLFLEKRKKTATQSNRKQLTVSLL